MKIPAIPENCKTVPDFPSYCVRKDGTVFSCFNNKWGISEKWNQLKSGTNDKYGRKIVVLVNIYGKHKSMHVHRVVLMAFIGQCPNGMVACHNNGDASDNRIDNLRWDTEDSNYADMRRHGKMKGERHFNATLNNDIVRQIRARASIGETHQSIANDLGLQRRNVSRIIDRTRWSHVI